MTQGGPISSNPIIVPRVGRVTQSPNVVVGPLPGPPVQRPAHDRAARAVRHLPRQRVAPRQMLDRHAHGPARQDMGSLVALMECSFGAPSGPLS